MLLTILGSVASLWIPIEIPEPPVATRFTDRNGVVLADRPVPERARGQWLDAFPERVTSAMINAEDHRFRDHWGTDPVGIARAMRINLESGTIRQGGSTITQQLVRNIWDRPSGLVGKAWEAWMAVRLENSHSKDDILTEYLNRVYFGNHAYGIDAAAHVYFDKTVAGLSMAEVALLVALPRRPSGLDPWRHPDAAVEARERVLMRLAGLGQLSVADAQVASKEPLGLRPRYPWSHAPHFIRRLETGRTRAVQTTLDLRIQQMVVEVVQDTVTSLKLWNVSHAAVLVVDNESADVLAYVGSADWTATDGQVDGVSALRSPGSTLKPFLVQQALERRQVTLATIQPDLPKSWSTTHGTWSPRNYDKTHNGPVRVRSALARSLNIPAADLLNTVGVSNFLERLRGLGFESLQKRPDHYGLGLVLGDGEVRLDELVGAYRTMADGGRYRPLVFRLGQDTQADGRDVVDPRAAWMVRHVLDDAAARAPAFGVDSVLESDVSMAAKTGTSVGWRDNWAVGVTPTVTVGVWVGNFDGKPMNDVSGITGAAPILRRIVDAINTADLPLEDPPDGVVPVRICPLSGERVSEACPGGMTEMFLEGTEPHGECTWHELVRLADPTDGDCSTAVDALSVNWPPRFVSWAAESGKGARRRASICRDMPESPSGAAPPVVGISWPDDGIVVYMDPRDPVEQQALHLRASAPRDTEGLEWALNGEVLARVEYPFTHRWVPTVGDHRIELKHRGSVVDSIRLRVGGEARD
mgnify:CR=1 FL=1